MQSDENILDLSSLAAPQLGQYLERSARTGDGVDEVGATAVRCPFLLTA